MRFKDFFLLSEIKHSDVSLMALQHVKLPWENIFKGKLRIKIDYTPDYSFLNTDEIVYVQDKKAFFKTKDTRQNNKIKMSKLTDANKDKYIKALDVHKNKVAALVQDLFDKNPDEAKDLSSQLRMPIDMIIDGIKEEGLTFLKTYYITKQQIRPWIEYRIPNFKDYWRTEEEVQDKIKDFDLIKNSTDKYSLIISRAPIDVLRASDYSNIQSCLSPSMGSKPKGIHYDDLCTNVTIGAGIVYILPELKIEDKDLQSEEIFKDVTRQIEGHSPIARLMIRQFRNENGDQLMIPEVRIFGSLAENMKLVVYKEIAKIIKEIQGITGPIKEEEWRMVGSKYIDTEVTPYDLIERFNKI